MSKLYTKSEKKQLIDFLKAETDSRIAKLKREFTELSQESENKILRRLNNVSATLWNVKLKDVLMVERHHKPSIKSLLFDIQSMKQGNSQYKGSFIRDSKISKIPPKRIASSHR